MNLIKNHGKDYIDEDDIKNEINKESKEGD